LAKSKNAEIQNKKTLYFFHFCGILDKLAANGKSIAEVRAECEL